ncbi:GntR family transcriptional regulator [Leifsonia poae]|uniref:GntR family transcriptional regulator n=1 Tax=Leifsonia poae TaxID=110933 RepID=UPI001CBD5B6C|nr:GntR family transcriptional regulator [Leifsonia poae]
MPMPSTDHVPRISLSDEAYARIETAILDGALAPTERLRDQDLVDWLGISRTPIRHALDRLAEHGLVEMQRNRYTRVAPFDIAGVRGALEVAGDLWSGAVRRGLPLWHGDDVDSLIESFGLMEATEDDLPTFVRIFEHLVTACVRLEGNPARLRALANVIPHVHRLARMVTVAGTMDSDRLRRFVDDVNAAIRERDAPAAADHIDHYIARLAAAMSTS